MLIEVKSGLRQNGLLAASSVKMLLQHDISMRLNLHGNLEAILASNNLVSTSLILAGHEQN